MKIIPDDSLPDDTMLVSRNVYQRMQQTPLEVERDRKQMEQTLKDFDAWVKAIREKPKC